MKIVSPPGFGQYALSWEGVLFNITVLRPSSSGTPMLGSIQYTGSNRLAFYMRKSYTKNNLRYALDCTTTVESTSLCFAALGRADGKYVSLDPFSQHAATRAIVKTDWVLGPSIFGDGSTWPEPYGRPPNSEIRAYGEKVWAVAQKLGNDGKLRPHPVRVLEGGLDQVLEGMELVRSGKLSGEKCVLRLNSQHYY